MPYTGIDLVEQAVKDVTELISQLDEYQSELESLNKEYGERARLLTKERAFGCQECGYQEEFIPHKKILKGEYEIRPSRRVHARDGHILYSFTTFDLVFLVDCECPNENKVHSVITLGHALKVLREERDFVKESKRRPYESMVV